MRKLKILFSLIVLLCLIIIVNSNWTFFSNMYAFNINLYIPIISWPPTFKLQKIVYNIPPAATGLYLLGSFILGALYIYIKTLTLRFQSSKQIKTLETSNRANTEKIADLKKEVDFLQRNASKPSPPQSAPVEAAEKTIVTETASSETE